MSKLTKQQAVTTCDWLDHAYISDVPQSLEMIFDSIHAMGINTKERFASFIGNCAHESGNFSVLEENLNYSAERLCQVWPSRFKSRSKAKRCARNPKELAKAVYNGRMGNRMGTDDGWTFRGRGFIQLTGRNNYTKIARATRHPQILTDPDILIEELIYSWMTAARYFCDRKIKGTSLLEHADKGNHRLICKAINGGYHGLQDRIAITNYTLGILNGDEAHMRKTYLRKGSRGVAVRELQERLRRAGFKIYRIDGIFGKGTERQIKELQAGCGFTPDGIVGPLTWEVLASHI